MPRPKIIIVKMGDPTTFDMKMLFFRGKFKKIYFAIGLLFSILIIFIPFILFSPSITKSMFLKKNSVQGDVIKDFSLSGNKFQNNSIPFFKISNAAGKGLKTENGSLTLKISDNFWFDRNDTLHLNGSHLFTEIKSNTNDFSGLRASHFSTGNTETVPGDGDIVSRRVFAETYLHSPLIRAFDIVLSGGEDNDKGRLFANNVETNSLTVGKTASDDKNRNRTASLIVNGDAEFQNVNVVSDKTGTNGGGHIFSNTLTAEKIQTEPGLAQNPGDLGVSGEITAQKLVLDKNGPGQIALGSGEISAQKISLRGNGLKGSSKSARRYSFETDGGIVAKGDIETEGNIVSLGYVKANTLKLGLTSDTPTNSGEISANFITVKDSANKRIRLHGHDAKITLESNGEEKIVLDGETGTITLRDDKGQKTTISVDNILEDTSVNDLTIEGKDSFLMIKEGGVGNDYIQMNSKSPKIKMVNRQGFSELNTVEIDSVYPELRMVRGKISVSASAKEKHFKLTDGAAEASLGLFSGDGKNSSISAFLKLKNPKNESFYVEPNLLKMESGDRTRITLDSETSSLTLFNNKNQSAIALSADSKTITLFNNNGTKSRLVLGPDAISIFGQKERRLFSVQVDKNSENSEINFQSDNGVSISRFSPQMAFFGENNFSARYTAENVTFGEDGGRATRLSSNGLEFVDKNGDSVTYIGAGGINIKNERGDVYLTSDSKNGVFKVLFGSEGDAFTVDGKAKALEIKGAESNVQMTKSSLALNGDKFATSLQSSGDIAVVSKADQTAVLRFSAEKRRLELSASERRKVSLDGRAGLEAFDGEKGTKVTMSPSGSLSIGGPNGKSLFADEGKLVLKDAVSGSELTLASAAEGQVSIRRNDTELRMGSDRFEMKKGQNSVTIDSESNIGILGNQSDVRLHRFGLEMKNKNDERISLALGGDGRNGRKNGTAALSLSSAQGDVKISAGGGEGKDAGGPELRLYSGEGEGRTAQLSAERLSLRAEGKGAVGLSAESAQLGAADVGDAVCGEAGQLVVGTGTCRKGRMGTAVWVGICQDKGFLRCPLPS